MTKEELKKRAEEYALKEVYYGAYVDEEVGMEIAEEAYIEATERETKLLQDYIIELEKENAVLKEVIKELNTGLDKLYLSGLTEKQVALVENLQDRCEKIK